MTVDGRAVALTATEYEILRILSVNAGRVATSESLLRQAWDARDSTDTERVRAFVKQIRAKRGDDAARPAYIFNEPGVGLPHGKAGRGVRAVPASPVRPGLVRHRGSAPASSHRAFAGRRTGPPDCLFAFGDTGGQPRFSTVSKVRIAAIGASAPAPRLGAAVPVPVPCNAQGFTRTRTGTRLLRLRIKGSTGGPAQARRQGHAHGLPHRSMCSLEKGRGRQPEIRTGRHREQTEDLAWMTVLAGLPLLSGRSSSSAAGDGRLPQLRSRAGRGYPR